MKPFSHQARWNFLFSVTSQGVSLGFIALTSRMLGHVDFGYYIWITALPGMVVVFDLYLGLSLQNRLTELLTTKDQFTRDRLVWGFIWGMLGISLIFLTVCVLVVYGITSGSTWKVTAIPSQIIWLGLIQVASAALGVPLLVTGVGFNAARQVHRGAAWALGTDILSKAVFLLALAITESFPVSIALFAMAAILSNVVVTTRFMRLFNIAFIAPSLAVTRTAFRELWVFGNAREWVILRVADGFFKNSELVIGAFVINTATIGDFAVLDRLSNALMLAANSAYAVLVPALAAAGASGDKSRMAVLTKTVGRLSLAALILFSVVFLAGGEWIASLWAGRTIDFSLLVVVLVCARAWTRVLSNLYWNILFGYELICGLLWATIISGGIYAVLYGALISRYGVLSILIAQIIAQGMFILVASRLRGKFHLAVTSGVAEPV
jgi:O-antigen/teichoic acid export membrane protein